MATVKSWRFELLVGMWWRENKNDLVEWKELIDTMGIKSADLEDKFLLQKFQKFQQFQQFP